MTRAVCPGSFDPVTHGHLDVIERTARVVDQVVVAVGTNIAKNALFSPDERVEMLAEECARWSNVEVTLFRGLLVDFCAANDIQVISKGCVVGFRLRAPDGSDEPAADRRRHPLPADRAAVGIRVLLSGPGGRNTGWRRHAPFCQPKSRREPWLGLRLGVRGVAGDV